jgi:predicted nucleotidyltransferase component of viral defense system
MNGDSILKRLKNFTITNPMEGKNAVREVAQELVLAALAETDFFEKAIFHGGTSLRILYGINRYSEDLDFALIKKDTSFQWEPYLEQVMEKMNAYGCSLEALDKSKADSTVKKAFIKESSIGQMLHYSWVRRSGTPEKVRIKLEIDSNPPSDGKVIKKTLDFPFSHKIATHDLPSQFAGKCNALLSRAYLKGRDWYDFLWYVDQKIKPNYKMLSSCLDQQGKWEGQHIKTNRIWLFKALKEKIDTLDITMIKEELFTFVNEEERAKIEQFDKTVFMAALDNLNRYSLTKEKSRDTDRSR